MEQSKAYCLFAAVFVFLLLVCVYTDRKQSRIPNIVPVLMTIAAGCYRAFGQGHAFPFISVTGLLIPFLILFPAFLIRGIGAGDVKLLMAVGAAAGPESILRILLAGFLIGGSFGAARKILYRRTPASREEGETKPSNKVHMALPIAAAAGLWLGGVI